MKSIQKPLIIFLFGLVILLLLMTAGCSPSQPAAPAPQSAGEEDGFSEIDGAVEDWAAANVSQLAEEIGSLVTLDAPFARDMAARAIKDALLSRLVVSIEQAAVIEDTDRCSARVKLEFPFEMRAPVVGRKVYSVSVDYDLIIEDGKVTGSEIDSSSFKMTEISY